MEDYTEKDIDKIRPEWDWKTASTIIGVGRVKEIKSDQNGIESSLLSFLRTSSVER